MQCPNCQNTFVEERADKFRCAGCGWFEKVDDEWRVCEPPPEPEPQGPQPPEPQGPQPPEPQGPQPPEPRGPQPPEPKVTEYLGGLVTVTELDE